MEETLLVIDMQDAFISRSKAKTHQHYPKVIDAVAEQCSLAMRRDDHIIFVEYNCSESKQQSYAKEPGKKLPTLPELVELTNDYERRFFAFKELPNGSEPISTLIKSETIPHSTIRICGVYTFACVFETLKGLLHTLPNANFKVVRAACGELFVRDTLPHTCHIQDLVQLDSQRITAIGPHLW